MVHYPTKEQFLSDIVPYILVMVTPLFACLIFFICNGSSIFNYDAFNTRANDELGYYHNIRMIRLWWGPEGYTGYNEVLTPMHGYGPYNVLTYVPYVIVSFLTGISSHNFVMYCNLIMILISYAILVRFSEMSLSKSITVSIFLSTFLVADYYILSGMTEATHIAFMVTVFGVMYRLYLSHVELNVQTKWIMIWVITALIIFYGIIRPYELIFILLPLLYVLKKEEKLRYYYAAIVSILTVFAVLIYFYLANNYGSPYFTQFGSMGIYLDYLKHGQIIDIIADIVQKNIESLNIITLLKYGSWNASVITLFISLVLIMGVLLYTKLKRRELGARFWFDSILLFSAVAIFESNILLYTSTNLERTLLGISVLLGLSLCMQLEGRYRLISIMPTACVSLIVILALGGGTFVLPQESENNPHSEDAALRAEFESLMPFVDDPWDHTITFEPQFSDMYVMYLFPSYLGMQCCSEDYLLENIDAHTLKSKYVGTEKGSPIDAACQSAGISEIWTNGDWGIYATR